MKKQRPHSGSRAAKRARKARASSKAAEVATATVAAACVSSHSPSALHRDSKQARHTKADAWIWYADDGKAGPRRRAKGPPPRPQPNKPRSDRAARNNAPERRNSKLAPHLAAIAARPRAPVQPALSASLWMRSALATVWREDRIAGLVLLVPTLLVASVLMLSPRQRAPLDQSPLVAVWRGPSPVPPAVQESAPMVAQIEVPFSRRAERTTASVPMARHDLDAVSRTLANDVRWAVAAAGPPYERPAEGSVATVPAAVHDLSAAVAALGRDAEQRRTVAAITPYTRVPERSLSSTEAEIAVAGTATDIPTCKRGPNWQERLAASRTEPVSEILGDARKFGLALAEAAKAQTADLVIYNAKYMTIAFPGGDVPELFGVCTDVVIRAYRTLGIDLQELVHLSRPRGSDTSIDHRRTEVLRQFFATHGEQLATSPYIEDYMPGDIVTYYRPQNKSSQSHIAVVTDVIAPSGRPMIAHNRGWGVQLEDALFVDQMTGHYRYRGPQAANALIAADASTTPRTAMVKVVRQPTEPNVQGQLVGTKKDIGQRTDVQPSASAVRLVSAPNGLAANTPRMGLGLEPPPRKGR